MDRNWDNLPYANDGAYFTQEKAKIEAEAQKRIFLHKNRYAEFYKVENTLEIQLKNITLADIGISTIGAIFASIAQGIEWLYKNAKISEVAGKFAKWTFIVEGWSIMFVYNKGTEEFYSGLSSIVYDLFVLGITAIVIELFITTWWIAILVAAFIALIASIFANTQWGKDKLDLLAQTIESNVKKAKNFFEKNKERFFEYFNDGGNLLQKLSEILTKPDFSEGDLENILTKCGYCRANGNAWLDFIHNYSRNEPIENICNPDGTIKQSYKDAQYRAFYQSVEFRKSQKNT
ncbi:hypothetical protein [Helicobacter sp. T3_23-1059]